MWFQVSEYGEEKWVLMLHPTLSIPKLSALVVSLGHAQDMAELLHKDLDSDIVSEGTPVKDIYVAISKLLQDVLVLQQEQDLALAIKQVGS